ncbi:methyltransferase-like protein 25 [Agrilus planipennis]|uniref:Methyltransferase-like protein 25 n=1 Tax=Agrilus planipennis TaxID=224129 RepID=A0A1W4XDP1_AGRPL|nr:methyltransferase-like protein 25 [Agrilus planipennis]
MLCNMQTVCSNKQILFNHLFKNNNNTRSSFKNCRFNGFMSSKKAHEVTVLNEISCLLYDTGYVTHFVDIGDGKGYLSSLLALNNQIQVLGIDSSHTKTQSSVHRTNLLERKWNGFIKDQTKRKMPENKKKTLYKQVTHFVTENTDFEKLVLDNLSSDTSKVGLLGLHTCGNLGASSIKIFIKNPKMSALCNVSCCYHFLTENDENNLEEYYFPLSKFLSEKNFKLGRNARMLAAQSLERILHKSEEPNTTNFYRAILQVFLKKHNFRHFNIGRIKSKCCSFEEYARTALKKTNLNISDNELRSMYELYEGDQNAFIAFYLLRCYLAPAIESLILLDRLMYLNENGIKESYLVQLFDPIMSPRCYGLVALKKIG